MVIEMGTKNINLKLFQVFVASVVISVWFSFLVMQVALRGIGA